jgi:acetyl esterase/lipase
MRFQPPFIAVLFVAAAAAFAAEPDDCPRDLSGLDLGLQGEPRESAEEQEDGGRAVSRRAARRARRAARGWRRSPAAEPVPAAATDTLVDAPDASEPAPESATDHPRIRRIRDLPYVAEGHPRQRFDLFLPGGQASEPRPLLIWIHGTTWRDGSKDDCPVTWLVDEGYAVASVGYRLTDTAVFPAQLDDCLEAVDHLQAAAATWNLDPSRFAIAGAAAGGHLAALVGLAEERVADPARPRVCGVCVVSAPTLLTSLGPAQDRAGSPASLLVGGPLPEFREAAQRASPLTHVSSDAPPFLIIHAKGRDGDPAVPIEQSRQFDEALRAAGVKSTLVVIDKPATKSTLVSDSRVAEPLAEFLRRSFHRSGGR